MKKTLLFILTLIIGTHLFAQSKSQVLLYGNLSGSFGKNQGGQKSHSARVAPGVGYHISDRLAVGIHGAYSISGNRDTGVAGIKTSTTNWTVGPFVRYTQPLGEMFFLFGQLDLGYDSEPTGKLNGVKVPKIGVTRLSADFYPSVGMNLANGFALNFAFGGLNYRYEKSKSSPSSSQNASLTFGGAFQFGLSKFFGGYGKDALNNRY